MNAYRYKKVDAFTSGNSLGNPAACIYLDDDQSLSPGEMLAIAKQHEGFVSEVVYCKRSAPDAFDMAYFSSECEVDFCGHGTIACLYSLVQDNTELLGQEKLIIRTAQKGTLPVYNHIREHDSILITAPEPRYLTPSPGAKEIAENLHIAETAIERAFPVEVIDAGLRTLIVPIATLNDEIHMFPDEQRLKAFCIHNDIDIILVYSREVENSGHIAHSRVFAPRFGYLEDPATGSGNSAFGYYMLKNGIWNGESAAIEQGGADRVYNVVKLSLLQDRVLFGGSATTRISGVYYL